MKTQQSRYKGFKGFASFDALFSLLPIVVLLLSIMNISNFIYKSSSKHFHDQQLFDKLISVSDYVVKSGVAVHNQNVRYPNLLTSNVLTGQFIEETRKRFNFQKFYLSTSSPSDNYEMCIYRLVIVGDNRQIAKLYVCGE